MLITCRHFKLQGVYKEFNIFICFSVKPSVAVTEQSVENKNKRMFMEVLHQMLTRQKQDTQQHLVTNGQGNWKTWQSHSIFTIMISFLISLCAEVLKIKVCQYRWWGRQEAWVKYLYLLLCFHVSAFFSYNFKLIFGKSSVFVIRGVESHKSAWLFRTNETASNAHRSWTFLAPPSQPPFGTTFYSWLHKRKNHVVVCEVRRWYSVTFNLLYPKYGTQWASEGYKGIIE